MIEFVRGNIFDSGAGAIVCPVNAVGTMGAGLAKEFKLKFPVYYKAYQAVCRQDALAAGRIHVHKHGSTPRYIVSVATKGHWRYASRAEWVASGLEHLDHWFGSADVETLALPALGCGYGNLSWNTVKPLILSTMKDRPGKRVFVYEPGSKGNTRW